MNPEYPIYIVSKGRWESRLTSKALERMAVPYYMIVEKQEYEKYVAEIFCGDIKTHCIAVLVLPQEYLHYYKTCDELGNEKSKGPGAARNFAWQHSRDLGYRRHWVMDDNIASFNRLNRNLMCKVDSGTIFRVAECFVDRYTNIGIAGFNYDFFAKAKEQIPPFVLNTRIYSCLLVDNNIPFRWRGRYNEDTDLSLCVLKAGYCTVQFNAFLQEKSTTQKMKGGNTDAFYAVEGTLPKSQMLADLHPDVAKVVWRFNRWHHHVDYRAFKKNKLIKHPCINLADRVNNFGMKLVRRTDEQT